jgi:endonuclease YncB( thermonuclease family)
VALYRDTSETDRFDRLLRYVFSGEVFVNYSLVEKGVAWQRDYPPDSSCKDLLERAQKSAQRAQLGIWKKQ